MGRAATAVRPPTPKEISMYEGPSEADVAWAAGLFEGEGCLNAYRRPSGKWSIQLRLGMTDRDVVEQFAAIVGCGSVHRLRVSKAHAHWKPMYQWYVQSGTDVVRVIDLLLPRLGTRRSAKALEVREVAAQILPYGELRTHCRRGHPYEGDNLILEPSGVRRCRTCRTEQGRERMRRVRNIAPENYRVKENEMAPSQNIKKGPQKSPPPSTKPAGQKTAPTPSNPRETPTLTGQG